MTRWKGRTRVDALLSANNEATESEFLSSAILPHKQHKILYPEILVLYTAQNAEYEPSFSCILQIRSIQKSQPKIKI